MVIGLRNGDLLVMNANDNRLVVITPGGKLVAIHSATPSASTPV
jgi:hypothetical protein